MLNLHHVHCLFVSVIAEEPKSEEAKTDDAKVEEAKAEESEPKTEQTESNEEQKPGSELFKLQGVKKQPLFVIQCRIHCVITMLSIWNYLLLQKNECASKVMCE